MNLYVKSNEALTQLLLSGEFEQNYSEDVVDVLLEEVDEVSIELSPDDSISLVIKENSPIRAVDVLRLLHAEAVVVGFENYHVYEMVPGKPVYATCKTIEDVSGSRDSTVFHVKLQLIRK